jgi:hypothetical protein
VIGLQTLLSNKKEKKKQKKQTTKLTAAEENKNPMNLKMLPIDWGI